jgi:hypothetical protein
MSTPENKGPWGDPDIIEKMKKQEEKDLAKYIQETSDHYG